MRIFRYIAVSVAMLCGPGATAAPLADASSFLSVLCGADPTTRISQTVTVPAPASLSCDKTDNVGSFGIGESVAAALTSGGLIPQADVQANARGVPTIPNAGIASATAEISYSVRINATAPAPVAVFQVPVLVTIEGEGTADPGSIATAEVVVAFFRQQFSTPRNAIPSPGGTFDVDIQTTLNFGVGNDFRVRKQASCTARTDTFPQTGAAAGVTSACHAVIDPMFDFDQAAFDAMLGARSFLLDDFFEFEFSPNLMLAAPIDVPEPPAIVLFCAFAFALFLARRPTRNLPVDPMRAR
jgi:hypothetical protein